MATRSPVDKKVFWPAIIFILTVTALLVIFSEEVKPIIDSYIQGMNTQLDWIFEFLAVFLMFYLFYLAFSRKGDVLLGREAKPQFGNFSYGAMLFCAGMGTSIMFWSIIEPMYYYQSPPFGVEGETVEAAHWALTYGLFHWGVSAWAIYTLPTIVIAYSIFNKGNHNLKLSRVCADILGKQATGPLGVVIDVLVIWSLVGGLGTSLGLGVPMMSAGIGSLLEIEHSIGLDVAIIIIWSIIYLTSAVVGLDKGIRNLSNFNVYLAVFLVLIILLVGPTSFIFSYFTDSLGRMADSFFRISFYTDPLYKSSFPQSWTVFYWIWFACTAPFLGLFVARISRGRTLRNVIIQMISWGSLGGWLYFAVLGGYTMDLQLSGQFNVVESMQTQGDAVTVISVIATLPWGKMMVGLFVVLGFIFLATSLDSASFVLASIASNSRSIDEEPARWHIIIWGLLMSGLAISLLFIGGLSVVQSSTITMAVPILIIYLLLILSLHKWLSDDLKPSV